MAGQRVKKPSVKVPKLGALPRGVPRPPVFPRSSNKAANDYGKLDKDPAKFTASFGDILGPFK